MKNGIILILRRLIAPIFAVFFAAGLSVAANAQQATGTAYTAASGTFAFSTGNDIDLSGTIIEMVNGLRGGSQPVPAANTGGAFQRQNQDGTSFTDGNSVEIDMVPTFGSPPEPLDAGNTLGFENSALTPGTTVYLVYRDGNDLRLAMTMSAEDVAESELNGRFYLTNDNVRSDVPSSDVIGHDLTCDDGNVFNTDGSACEMLSASGSNNTGENNNGGGGDSNNDVAIAIGLGAIALFTFAVLGSGGDADAFSFSPDFGYSATESGYSYNYGTRLDFAENNWRLYWTAGQTNRNGDFGDFSYASGGEYRSDSGLWTTAFSESISGEIANYNFSLSAKTDFVSPANFGGGIWNLSPTYRFNSVLDWAKEESESRNSLNIESVLRMNRWTIRPTAGFTWRRLDEFGNSAKFGISAVHRF